MSKNIFSQAHTKLKYENGFLWVKLLLYPISICIFFFSKGGAVSSSFYDTNFSLETFYKT